MVPPEGPRQGGELGYRNLQQFNQEVELGAPSSWESPAPGEEQPHASRHAEGNSAGKQFGRRGAGGPGGIKLNISQQGAAAATKAKSILGCIRHSITPGRGR